MYNNKNRIGVLDTDLDLISHQYFTNVQCCYIFFWLWNHTPHATPQILPPKRVRDSRHLNGDKAADADTKTPYVTTKTSLSTCQKSKHPRKNKQNEMLCQKCTLFRGELQKAQNNIRLIEYLIEDAGSKEKTQDNLDRLAMLHKHARTNYKDMANLTFALNHCENQPPCSDQW